MGNRQEAELRAEHYSVSQVELFEACPRSWVIQKCLGLAKDQSTASLKGGLGHGLVERYYKTGTLPSPKDEMGRQVIAHVQALPPWILRSNPKVEVEKFWKLSLPVAPAWWVDLLGYMDLHLPPTNATKDMPVVMDHKFTGNLQYAKSVDYLKKEDIQSTTYCMWAMLHYKKTTCVGLWQYCQMTGAVKIEQRKFKVSIDEVTPRFTKTVQSIRHMYALRRHIRRLEDAGRSAEEILSEVVGNDRACMDYGGRSCRSHCHLHKEEAKDTDANSIIEGWFA